MLRDNTGNRIEISVRGRWITVPALDINGKTVIITGRWLKTAAVHDDEWSEGELEDPEGFIRTLKERELPNLRADLFTFAQKLPATGAKYRYPMEWDNIAAIRLTSFTDWWARVPQETRKNTRRSTRRGVAVTIRELDDDLIAGIVAINNESAVRQGARFPHYGKSHDAVKKDYLSFLDRSEFICAHSGNELIGVMKMVYCGSVAAILQLLSKKSHYDKRPSNAIIATAIERCEKRRVSYVTYGKYRYGNQGKTSLMEFKARNGFEAIPVPRYYIPLTARGKIGMMFRLHRDLVEVAPELAVRFAVNLRVKWHNRMPEGRCSSMVEQPKL